MKRVNNVLGLVASLLAVSILNVSSAISPPPPMPVDELVEFYHAMDGDNWHRNGGWLDPEVDVCDWHGITCVTESPEFGGFQWVGHVRLADNNLSGEMTAELVALLMSAAATTVPSRQLDLSGNRITGELPVLPLDVPVVKLAGNALTGPLPEVPNGDEEFVLEELDLSRNALTGPVPDSWAGLELRHLRLSVNGLEGSIEPALAALSLDELVHLDVADNQFSGALPDEMMALMPYRLDGSRTGSIFDGWKAAFPHGLNLCWNDFEPPAGALADFIDQHHHGGRFADCQRPRQVIDSEFSGSWFNPERDGEGFVQHLLDTGQLLLFWFTFPRSEELDQSWYLGLADADDASVWMEDLHAFRGQFGFGRHESDEAGAALELSAPFRLSINRLEANRQHIAYSRSVVLGGSMTGLVSYGLESLRHDQVPLTRLAGSTCDNQRATQHLSGAWYNPERDGEGFMVEVNEDGLGVLFWFTYMPDDSGQRAWMLGTGEIEESIIGTPPPDFPQYVLEIDNLTRPTGTVFGSDFQSEDVVWEEWGGVTIEFFRQGTGHVFWNSVDEAFGSGDYPIEPLTRPMLAECED